MIQNTADLPDRQLLEQLETQLQFEAFTHERILPSTQAESIIHTRCYQALCSIRNILSDERLDDTACFERIERILEVFEQLGSDGGSRHDF